MAIVKWIPFSSPHAASASHDPKAQPIPAISPADAKKFGLENFGNICYANSVLQALYFCAPFRELLLQYGDSSVPPHVSSVPLPPPPHTPHGPPPVARWKPERKVSGGVPADALNPNVTAAPAAPTIPSSSPTLVSALRSLFLFISKNPADKGTVAPRAFIDKLKEVNELFRSTMHQDAHEFLNYLLNKIVEEIEEERRQATIPIADDLSNSVGTLSSKSPPTIVTTAPSSNSGVSPQAATLVHTLFEGVLTSETRCLTCETVSSRDEAFLDLSVDIEQNSSITACLRQFSASEMLCNKNKFFCDSCCDLQEAEKRMKIKNLPNILALHLKRFKYQEDVQKYIKLAYRVAFPLELRLFNTVDDTGDADRLFELFAIVIHIGNGPHHGHYITIVKTMGTWVVFDDDAVEQIKESEIPRYFGDSNSGSAYVLYYQAVDLDLTALGFQPVVQEPVDQVLPLPQSADSPQIAPALPPGLVEEGDYSDVSEPMFPVTSSVSSSPILEPLTRSAQPEAPTVTITFPDETSAPSPNPTSPSTSRKLFNSLRRKVPSEQSPAEEMPRFRSSAVARRSEDWITTSLPPIRSGKEPEPQPEPQSKEPEGKVGTWFTRRVSKLDKSRRSLELPPTTRVFLQQEGEASPSGTTSPWYNSMGAAAGHETGPTINRLPSEPGMLESFNALGLQAPSTGSHLQLLPTQGRADRPPDSQSIGSMSSSAPSAEVMIIGPSLHPPSFGYVPSSRQHDFISASDSHSAGSPSSTSTSSGSAGPPVEFPSSTSSLPQWSSHPGSMYPTRSSTPSTSAPAIPPRSPRRSQSQSAGLSSFSALDSPPPPPPARHPHRSQAHTISRTLTTRAGSSGSDKGNSRHSAPVLSRSQSAKPAPSSTNTHRTSHRMESPPPPAPPKPTAAVYTNGRPPGFHRANGQNGPEDWHNSASPETMTFAGANNSTSSAGSGSATTSLKRASGKLSLTAPMLGFGRKDKEREKDKHKDRERERTAGVEQRSREREQERERKRSQDTSVVHPWISFAHF